MSLSFAPCWPCLSSGLAFHSAPVIRLPTSPRFYQGHHASCPIRQRIQGTEDFPSAEETSCLPGIDTFSLALRLPCTVCLAQFAAIPTNITLFLYAGTRRGISSGSRRCYIFFENPCHVHAHGLVRDLNLHFLPHIAELYQLIFNFCFELQQRRFDPSQDMGQGRRHDYR